MNPCSIDERLINMTIAFLHRLTNERLPLILHKPIEIDAAHVLVLAGHVRATFSNPEPDKAGRAQPVSATVHAVTPLGRRFARSFPEGSPSALGPAEAGR